MKSIINFVQISVDFFLNNLIDYVIGEAVIIGEQKFVILILNFGKFSRRENLNNWLIGFRMDFNYEVKIVNKKHPKHKQILKLINISVEHGIKQRAEALHDYGFIILFYLFEKLSNSQVVNQVKYELNKKREQITLDELSSLFVLLLAAFPCLFVVFIIECIYYKYDRNIYWF